LILLSIELSYFGFLFLVGSGDRAKRHLSPNAFGG
jgi:hypothetical protein